MIVFIDDELERISLYAKVLSLEFPEIEVDYWSDFSPVMSLLEQDKVELLFLDLMMPPGDLGMEDTQDGFRTGVTLYEKIRRDHSPELPVIILTNVPEIEPDTMKVFESDEHCWYFSKRDLTLERLVNMVQEVLSSKK